MPAKSIPVDQWDVSRGQSSGREQPKKPRKPWMCCSCTTTLCDRDKTQCGNRACQHYCCRKCLKLKWIGGSDGRWSTRRYCPHCLPCWVPVFDRGTSQCGHVACERLASTRKEKERTDLAVAFSAVWERIEQDVLSSPGMLSEIGKRSWPPCYKKTSPSQESA